MTPDRQLTDTRQATDRHQPGTTAGVYALPAVQSKLRELRRRLAPLALCSRVHIRISHSRWPVTDEQQLTYYISAHYNIEGRLFFRPSMSYVTNNQRLNRHTAIYQHLQPHRNLPASSATLQFTSIFSHTAIYQHIQPHRNKKSTNRSRDHAGIGRARKVRNHCK